MEIDSVLVGGIRAYREMVGDALREKPFDCICDAAGGIFELVLDPFVVCIFGVLVWFCVVRCGIFI